METTIKNIKELGMFSVLGEIERAKAYALKHANVDKETVNNAGSRRTN